MTEPTSTAAGAYAGAVTALPLAIFGAATDALGLGLFAALLVTIWMPTISTRIRAFSAVLRLPRSRVMASAGTFAARTTWAQRSASMSAPAAL